MDIEHPQQPAPDGPEPNTMGFLVAGGVVLYGLIRLLSSLLFGSGEGGTVSIGCNSLLTAGVVLFLSGVALAVVANRTIGELTDQMFQRMSLGTAVLAFLFGTCANGCIPVAAISALLTVIALLPVGLGVAAGRSLAKRV